jgi:hypothetical protein
MRRKSSITTANTLGANPRISSSSDKGSPFQIHKRRKELTTMKFDINKYRGAFVMHCKTEEEARDFCNYLHSIGKEWWGGESYLFDTQWHKYKEDTAYNFNTGVFADIPYYRHYNYTILEWEDFMNHTFTKADLRTGDVILRRNGDVEIVNCDLKIFIRNDGEYNAFHTLNDNLTSIYSEDYDIVAVRRPNLNCDCVFSAFKYKRGTLIYNREQDEVEEMTLAEICKLLGKNIKIVE